jgi:hypothetical protein
LSPRDRAKLIESVENVIFRPIPSESLSVQNAEWSHLEIQYQILNAIIISAPNEKRFANIGYIRRLIERFRLPDPKEGVSVAELVIAIGITHPQLRTSILRMILNCMADCLAGEKSPQVIAPSLIVVYHHLLKWMPIEEDNQSVSLYFQYILPSITHSHFTTFSVQINQTIELFLNIHQDTAAPTMKALLSKFPVTGAKKAVEFLQLIALVIPHMSMSELSAQAARLFSVLANCAASGQTQIAAAALEVWNLPDLEMMVKEKPKLALKIAYPLLTLAQSECWSLSMAGQIDEILRILNRAKLSLSQARIPESGLDAHTASFASWGKIIRVVVARDSRVNLRDTLIELQRRLGAVKRAVAIKKSTNRQRSPVKVGSQPVTSGHKMGIKREIAPKIFTPF